MQLPAGFKNVKPAHVRGWQAGWPAGSSPGRGGRIPQGESGEFGVTAQFPNSPGRGAADVPDRSDLRQRQGRPLDRCAVLGRRLRRPSCRPRPPSPLPPPPPPPPPPVTTHDYPPRARMTTTTGSTSWLVGAVIIVVLVGARRAPREAPPSRRALAAVLLLACILASSAGAHYGTGEAWGPTRRSARRSRA